MVLVSYYSKIFRCDYVCLQGYGMTESTAVGTRGFNTKKFSKYFSVGLLAPNMQAKVVDWVNGCFLPPGSTGELWLRGPGTMKGGDKYFFGFHKVLLLDVLTSFLIKLPDPSCPHFFRTLLTIVIAIGFLRFLS